MNIKEICRKLSIQHFRMYSGFSYSEEKINTYQKELAVISKRLIHKADDKQYKLWLLGNIAEYSQTKLFLQQIKERSKLHYKKINYANWKMWLPNSKEEERKKVLDYFIGNSSKIKKVLKKRYEKISEVYFRYGESVLDSFLTTENLSEDIFKKIKSLGIKYKPTFKKAWKTLGVSKEYWNEYYYLGSILYKNINFHLEPKKYVKRIYKSMGFPFGKIMVDDRDRKNKFGFAYCFWPNPPYDVRVSYKPVGGFNMFETAFHEFGHAAHAVSMSPNVPFWKRFEVPSGVAETFSELFESISTNKTYLKSINAFSPELQKRIELSRAKFLTFYAANSLVKYKYWSGEIKFDEIGSEYSSLLKKFVGIEPPEDYWLFHHILSEFTIYSPSYVVADMHKNWMLKKLKNKFGREWWNSRDAGSFIKSFMAPAYDANFMLGSTI